MCWMWWGGGCGGGLQGLSGGVNPKHLHWMTRPLRGQAREEASAVTDALSVFQLQAPGTAGVRHRGRRYR
jgi:hypothetical protein